MDKSEVINFLKGRMQALNSNEEKHMRIAEKYAKVIMWVTREEPDEPTYDAIRPIHYNKGKIDLYESWYLTRPFAEFRAIMEAIAERYMKRDKINRLEDLDKAIYTLQRLREYEEKEVAG